MENGNGDVFSSNADYMDGSDGGANEYIGGSNSGHSYDCDC